MMSVENTFQEKSVNCLCKAFIGYFSAALCFMMSIGGLYFLFFILFIPLILGIFYNLKGFFYSIKIQTKIGDSTLKKFFITLSSILLLGVGGIEIAAVSLVIHFMSSPWPFG